MATGMAKPYSDDFRQKVITAIARDGRKKGEVSEIFNISRNTINLWLKRKEQTGAVFPKSTKPLSGRDQGHFILDLGDEFRWFQPSKTKISDAWNGAFS